MLESVLHTVQKQEINQVGTANFNAYIGEGRMTVHVNDTVGINLYPSQYEFLLGYEKEKVATTDRLMVTDLGEVEILGIITLWVTLETSDDDELPTIMSYEIDGAVKTFRHLINLDCRIILG